MSMSMPHSLSPSQSPPVPHAVSSPSLVSSSPKSKPISMSTSKSKSKSKPKVKPKPISKSNLDSKQQQQQQQQPAIEPLNLRQQKLSSYLINDAGSTLKNNKKNLHLNLNSTDNLTNANRENASNNSQRFLPKTLVIGSPFYNTSEGSFKSGFNTPTPTATSFHSNLHSTIIEEEDDVTNSNFNDESTDTKIDKTTKEVEETEIEAESETPIIQELEEHLKTSRALKLSNLNSNVTLSDVLILIQFGPIENCYFDLVEPNINTKNIVLLFIDCFNANKCFFHLSKSIDKYKSYLNSPELLVQKIESPPLSNEIQNEINLNGASRSICLSNMPPNISEIIIFNELSTFGPISTIKYVENKNSSFVNFTSIINAIKCFNQLSLSNSIFANCNLYYSNDLVFNLSSNSNSFKSNSINEFNSFSSSNSTNVVFEEIHGMFQNKQNIAFSASPTSLSSRRQSMDLTNNFNNFNSNISNLDLLPSNYISTPIYIQPSSTFDQSFDFSISNNNNSNSSNNIHNNNNLDNRCVYLGNLHPSTTNEDICNTIRGGNLESVKLIQSKRIAFVTFLDHDPAADLIAKSMVENIFINSKVVKIGWGKNSGQLNPIIAMSYSHFNATRNLYIGIDELLETEEDYDLVALTDDEILKLKNKIKSHPGREDELQNNSLDDDNNNNNNNNNNTFDPLKFKKVYKCIPSEEILRRDFSAFGEIEQINYFKNGACAFINFTNILNCIKTVEDFNNPHTRDKIHETFDNKYSRFSISYGKDRCGNPPKKKKKNRRKSNNDIYEHINTSVDSEMALKMDSAFEGIGISSPAAKKKVDQINKNQELNNSFNTESTEDDEDNDAVSIYSFSNTSSRRNSKLKNYQYNRKFSNKNNSRSSYNNNSNRNSQYFQPPHTPVFGYNNYSLGYSSTGYNDDFFLQQPVYYTPQTTQPPIFYPHYPNNPVYHHSNGSRNSRK